MEQKYKVKNISKLQILYEYDRSFFSYDEMTKDMWYDKVREAMKKFKVSFDLENNETTKQQREIVIPQKEWDFTKCKFKCEMYSAGGDWENPVNYFRCQLVDGYAFDMSKHGNSHCVYIPGKKEGNYHLVPRKDGWGAPNNDREHVKGIDAEKNDKDCWKSLEKYLKSLVDLKIEKVKSERKNQPEVS